LVVAALAAIGLVAVACTSSSSDAGSPSGSAGGSGAPIELTMWHGYGKVIDNQGQTNYEAKSLTDLVDEYNAMNTGIHVNLDYIGSNDNALTKLTVALNAGEPPDITYQYGTSMPQLATAPGIVDLTDKVQDPTFNWSDFSQGAQQAATVDGHVYGVPALIDNLAIVYNKDLFQQARVSPPTANWTWDDFVAAAKALTDPSKQQYGFAFPIDASEDTTWHYDAMLWEGGGDILNADNTQAAFNSDAGVQALTTLQQMAVTDKSVFLDQQNSGKIQQLSTPGTSACWSPALGISRACRTSTTACRSCPRTREGHTQRSPAPTCGSCSTTTGTETRRGNSCSGSPLRSRSRPTRWRAGTFRSATPSSTSRAS